MAALIYSTHHGAMCPKCRRPVTACTCARDEPPPGDGIVRVGRETKGRKGAGVTVVTGLPLRAWELSEMASRLKKKCASGGTTRDGVIEIQGDHRDTVVAELTRAGYKVKRVGG
jgi:translation initiation factor 1